MELLHPKKEEVFRSIIPKCIIAPSQVLTKVHHECKCQINKQRRTKSDKRSINKKQPDAGSRNAKFFTQSSTYSKSMLFNESLYVVDINHDIKLNNDNDRKNILPKVFNKNISITFEVIINIQ